MRPSKSLPRGVWVALVICGIGGILVLIGANLASTMVTFIGLTFFAFAIVGLQLPQVFLFFGIWIPPLTTTALRLLSWMEMDRD